jgi:uncharacterized membrane protein
MMSESSGVSSAMFATVFAAVVASSGVFSVAFANVFAAEGSIETC